MNNTLHSFALLVLIGFANTAFPQIDSLDVHDTLSVSPLKEQLLEQIPQEEDSPILDDVSASEERLEVQPSLSIRSRITQTLQQSEGFTGGVYLGPRIKSYHRMKWKQSKYVSGGILFEKDAGEQCFNDFTSGNLTISEIGPLRKIIFGDYLVEAGQGLTLWRGYDFSKGGDVVTPVKRKPRGLVPYVSSDENAFFRGAGMEFQTGNFQTSLFYSKRSRTASIDSNGYVTSFNSTGYFRTTNEQTKRDNISERLFGVREVYSPASQYLFGITVYKTNFSSPIMLDGGKKFFGQGYTITGVDYHVEYRAATFFGEWAQTNKTIAGLSGIFLRPDKTVNLIAVFRHYPYEFVSLHGLGFGERGTTSNETGLYLGIQIKPNRWLKLTSYFDQYRFPQPTSGVVFPSGGNDFLVQAELNVWPRSEITFRYQRKISEERAITVDRYGFNNGVNDRQRVQRVRMNVNYRLDHNVTLRSRLERVYFNTKLSQQNEKGLMIYQDIHIKSTDRLRWNARLTFFQTGSYESRIYEYENDLDGVSSLPGLYGHGVRWYVLVRYILAKRLELSAKYVDLIRDDVKRIGTGLDEIPTNHDNRFSFQLDFAL